MNGNVCEEEQRFSRNAACEGKCRSQFGKELTGATFEGGVLNISPSVAQLQVQYVNAKEQPFTRLRRKGSRPAGHDARNRKSVRVLAGVGTTVKSVL